jgi:hypothetical protein
MRKILAISGISFALLFTAGCGSGDTSSTYESVRDSSCCKICSTGKACGDSCISRSYTCHKGVGCACDAD